MMTKEELDTIVSYINRENMTQCPYHPEDKMVPKVCLKFCDTCIYKKAGYEHSTVLD